MIRFEWRFTRLFWISLLLAIIVFSNISISKVGASLPAPTKHCTSLQPIQQVGGFFMGGIYDMQQWAKICYTNGWLGEVPPRVWLSGSYQTVNFKGMVQQSITWRGAFRISPRKVDVGVDWIQTVDFFGVRFQRQCWMRTYVTAPDARLGDQRGNCG